MTTIQKYKIENTGATTVAIPVNCEILSVRAIYGITYLHVEAENHEDLQAARTFECFRESEEISYANGETRVFIGETSIAKGEIVLHVFERIDPI